MGATLTARLEAKIRRSLLMEMAEGVSESLEELDLSELLHLYGNWRSRFISARPRRVHRAAEFEAGAFLDALELISEKIRTGEELTPHLSRDVRVIQTRKDGEHRKGSDLDPMLAEWGVHHLHLGSEIDEEGFVTRSGELLFVGFGPEDAYLIGIYPHGAWVLRDVVERLARNWDGAGILMASEYATGVTQTFDEKDHAALRKAGVTVIFEVEGRVYSPPGQTLGGTPGRVTRQVSVLCWSLEDWSGREAGRLPTSLEGRPAYWIPAVREGSCGFACGNSFVEVGSLPEVA